MLSLCQRPQESDFRRETVDTAVVCVESNGNNGKTCGGIVCVSVCVREN